MDLAKIEENIISVKNELIEIENNIFEDNFYESLRTIELEICKSENRINQILVEKPENNLSVDSQRLFQLVAMKEACLFAIKVSHCRKNLDFIDEFSLLNLESVLEILKKSTLEKSQVDILQIKVFSNYVSSFNLKLSQIHSKFDRFWNSIFKFSDGINYTGDVLRSFSFSANQQQLKSIFSIAKFLKKSKPEHYFVVLVKRLFNELLKPFLMLAFNRDSNFRFQVKNNDDSLSICFIKQPLTPGENNQLNNIIKSFNQALVCLKNQLFSQEEEDQFMKAFYDLNYPMEMYLLLQKNYISQVDECLTLANIRFIKQLGYFDDRIVDEITRFVGRSSEHNFISEVVEKFRDIVKNLDVNKTVKYKRTRIKSSCFFDINELLMPSCSISQNVIDLTKFLDSLLTTGKENSKEFFDNGKNEIKEVICQIPSLILQYYLEKIRFISIEENSSDLFKCILFHNDCHYLGQYILDLLTFKIRPVIQQLEANSDVDQDRIRNKSLTLVPIRNEIICEGSYILSAHVKKHIESVVVKLTQDLELKNCHEQHVDQKRAISQLEDLMTYLKNLSLKLENLSSYHSMKMLGPLINKMIGEIIDQICSLKDITISGSDLIVFILKKVQNWAPQFVKNLYQTTMEESDEEITQAQIKTVLTNLSKMEGILLILEAESLDSIVVQLWNNQSGPLKKIHNLNKDLVHDLIKKLFAHGHQRTEALKNIN